jgi:hypothetical protein
MSAAASFDYRRHRPECGILAHGFGVVRCENADCRQKVLVALSCIGRRMCQSAANWVEHVLPYERLSSPERQLIWGSARQRRPRCPPSHRFTVDSRPRRPGKLS